MGQSAANRRTRLEQILARDEPTWVWCRRPVGVDLVEATTEHVIPRLKGGPSWIENDLAACKRCNGRRGHKNLADWPTSVNAMAGTPIDDASSMFSNRSRPGSPNNLASEGRAHTSPPSCAASVNTSTETVLQPRRSVPSCR